MDRPRGFLACAVLLTACGSGSDQPTLAPFEVLRTEPGNGARVMLTDPIRFVFTREIALETASLASVEFVVFDAASGAALGEQVTGTFGIGRDPEGVQDPHVLEFQPSYPRRDTFDDGGFRPGRRYVVRMATATDPLAPVLRDAVGHALRKGPDLWFMTPTGSTPAELFRNPRAGGPRRVAMAVSPSVPGADGLSVAPLNFLAREPVEVRLSFDQALSHHTDNLGTRTRRDPLAPGQESSRVWLEYDDSERGDAQHIPALLDLERNTLAGATLVLRPDGVLPNRAVIRVMVTEELSDIAGENNAAVPGFSRVSGRFRTDDAWRSQFDAVAVRFDEPDVIDASVAFLEPPAALRDGQLAAAYDFDSQGAFYDFIPSSRETVLNTDFTQVTPANGGPFHVSGGVFRFRHVHVREGALVRGVGTRPMVWLVTGDFRVDGRLSVDGGDGAPVHTLNSANYPTAGGVGMCTGGAGGKGSPVTTMSSLVGEAGYAPENRPNGGGRGGTMGCGPLAERRGSGGGGGSHATQGDPLINDGLPFANTVQVVGRGGPGVQQSLSGDLPGGDPGPLRASDQDPDNDFTGVAIDVWQRRRIVGEFTTPLGGAGGGGGGNRSSGTPCQAGPGSFIMDNKGGGGGGGGGVLIVKAMGMITVGPSGLISANGGHGGGGEQAANSRQGGGGGGGAGGVVILMSATGIELFRHGDTYQERPAPNKDASFSVSADGGVCLRSDFPWVGEPGVPITGKYPVRNPDNYLVDRGTGGYGGMGVVQLMAPPEDNRDGTNTVLDDRIHVIDTNGVRMGGADKQRFLAWAGIGGRDDQGRPIPAYGGGGDIRPRPHLLPCPFGRFSRAQTRWFWTGATVRRELAAPDGAARGLVIDPAQGFVSGPEFTMAGTRPDGFLANQSGSGVLAWPTLQANLPVRAAEPLAVVFEGRQVHSVTLAQATLGAVPDRYAHHRCLLRDASQTRRADLRILAHDADRLLLDPEDGDLPPGELRADVVARFFDVRTSGTPGLGPTVDVGGVPTPAVNVRVGFAFHRDPRNPDLQGGLDRNRYPQDPTQFALDLASPAARSALRDLHPEYVKVDVLFDLDWSGSQPAGPQSPRPALAWLLLPYRF